MVELKQVGISSTSTKNQFYKKCNTKCTLALILLILVDFDSTQSPKWEVGGKFVFLNKKYQSEQKK